MLLQPHLQAARHITVGPPHQVPHAFVHWALRFLTYRHFTHLVHFVCPFHVSTQPLACFLRILSGSGEYYGPLLPAIEPTDESSEGLGDCLDASLVNPRHAL